MPTDIKGNSVIRRKSNEIVFTTEGGKYLASRNKLKKAIRKALRNLKAIKSESEVFPSNKDVDTLCMLSILTGIPTGDLRTRVTLTKLLKHCLQ